ncbi:hypothetical protein [Leeuwenhoekiella marinoflava]|uniref:Uncharacterized protein n=2 Tax=Leeuwenhoekiella marinoflava TaxID=988 RepID=A0A4Q0PM71_9FLAO|nr:hypothetical protein [Leeuwenhoekiella marinoflava]RXG30685.1 hypothetical protein DSL99_1727 [Leeuwenhoekiella marinoflava]SHF19700.1 hypothetical protein SAMN02745246_01930 [Leeuwenhoekiella marinoflava DSM 3653]
MKQKDIVITGKLSLDAEDLIKEYFAVKRVKKIEGFLTSELEFIHRHHETYAYSEMRNADFHAIYQIKKCDICFKPYEVSINDRAHLYRYLQSTYKLCLGCKGFHYGVGQVLSIKLDGDIAS